MLKGRFWIAALTATAGFSSPALAIGCNGVVNPMLPGCSRADDNDGAQFPYFRAQRVAISETAARIEMKQGVPMVQYQGRWLPVASASRGNIIAISDSN
jgi:hypothetical protein